MKTLSRKIISILTISLLVIISTVISFLLTKLFKRSAADKEEVFDILNESGKVVSKAPRSVCHNGSKLLHPVVHIHIFNDKKQLLLQKRAASKDIQPGKWDTAVGGHVSSEESVENALLRECSEEAGFTPVKEKLIHIADYIYESNIEREYVHTYKYSFGGPFKHQAAEIDELKFFDRKEIEKLIKSDLTTENFKYEYENYLKNSL